MFRDRKQHDHSSRFHSRTRPRRIGLSFEPLERRELLFSTGFLSFIPPNILADLGIPPAQPVHENITQTALPFLKTNVLQSIVTADVLVDVVTLGGDLPNTSRFHFDNSQFAESTNLINQEYLSAVSDAKPRAFDTTGLAFQFGSLLHTVQDFYAHSNWVNFPDLANRLVETSDGLWNLNPAGVVLLEGPLPPTDTITRVVDPVTQLPTDEFIVQTPSGSLDGILTDAWQQSIFGSPNTNNTSAGIAISHDEINKDYSGRPFFDQAYNLAIQQTTHEFERLCHLIAAQYHQAGVAAFFQQWVKPDSASQAEAWQASGLPSSMTISVAAAGTSSNSSVTAQVVTPSTNIGNLIPDAGLALVAAAINSTQQPSFVPSINVTSLGGATAMPTAVSMTLIAAISESNPNQGAIATPAPKTSLAAVNTATVVLDPQSVDAILVYGLIEGFTFGK